MRQNIFIHEQHFSAFAKRYLDAEVENKAILDLKVLHTSKVLQHMRLLVEQEEALRHLERACLLTALYHDVARFPQFARWRTFKDSLSVNHGLMGVKVLKAEGWLEMEEPSVHRLTLAGVALHNRYTLPSALPQDLNLVADAVRDADKLDILRIMAEHLRDATPNNKDGNAVVLHVADEPDCWTDKVVDDVLKGRVAAYADLHYVNDFRLLLGTWLHDLRFSATIKQVAETGHIDSILQDLPAAPPVRAAKECILRRLEALRHG